MGSKILDLLEEESQAIRQMGQWNPSTFDNLYSTKLPMHPMRKLAGYTSDSKMYYNIRTTVDPPEVLLKSRPIGKFMYKSLDALVANGEVESGSKNATAKHVLAFFQQLNKVVLQDAAATSP